MPAITEISPEILRDRHRLSPQQINSIFGMAVINESPEEKAAALGKVGEFLRVTDSLTAAGISFIPLKGPLLSFRLYGDATIRSYGDLDILVEESSISKARDVLTVLGYQPSGLSWPEELKKQHRILGNSKHVSYTHPEKYQYIELHWRLFSMQWSNFREVNALVKNNLYETDFNGRKLTILNNELELLFLIIHGGIHNWSLLKWLADINEFLKSQEIKWERFNEQSEFLRAGRMVALCNAMLTECFPDSPLLPISHTVPPFMVKYSSERIKSADYLPPDSIRTVLKNIHFKMIVYPGLVYRIRMISNKIINSIYFGKIGRLFG